MVTPLFKDIWTEVISLEIGVWTLPGILMAVQLTTLASINTKPVSSEGTRISGTSTVVSVTWAGTLTPNPSSATVKGTDTLSDTDKVVGNRLVVVFPSEKSPGVKKDTEEPGKRKRVVQDLVFKIEEERV